MNTKTVLFSLSIIAAAVAGTAAHAAPASGSSADLKAVFQDIAKETATQNQTAIDDRDNRGFSLTFDDKYTPGSVVVSGVSKLAQHSGVEPGDVLTMVCTQPASLAHYNALTKIAGQRAEVMLSGQGGMLYGALPTVKWDNGQAVVSQAATLYEGQDNTGKAVPVLAGATVWKVCAPVRTALDVADIVAPFDWRMIGGYKLLGGWMPMDYVFYRNGFPQSRAGSVVLASLPSWNLPANLIMPK